MNSHSITIESPLKKGISNGISMANLHQVQRAPLRQAEPISLAMELLGSFFVCENGLPSGKLRVGPWKSPIFRGN